MSLTKKILISIFAFLALLFIVNRGLNLWLTNRLTKVINKNKDTSHYISYDKLTIDLYPSNIYFSNVVIVPKVKSKSNTDKIGVYAKTKSISITNFSIWCFLVKDIIKAQSISIEQPTVILYQKDKNASNIRKEVVAPFEKIIIVSNIYLYKGKLDVISNQDNKTILSTRNIFTKIEGIVINDAILERAIPFLYDDFFIRFDSLYFKPNPFYTLKAHKISTTNQTLSVTHLEYLPEYSRVEFIKKTPKEKDLFTIKASTIDINSMDWGFKDNVFFFNAKSVVFDSVNANIYRNKIPEDDLSKKVLYNALLRKIKFPLKIDTLLIRNSKLVYEEEINFEKGPAKLTFDQLKLNATHIQSGYYLKKATDVDIKINCRFMKNSPLKIHWTFNILDLKDGFKIKGNIQNFDIKSMCYFTKPYINASFGGVFNSFNFTIIGNDKSAYGNASLNFKDLDVTFYKKNNPEKEAKLKSAIAKLILKKDSDDKSKKTDIELERIQEKSFYNFLWRSIAESLKKILI